MRSAAQSKKAAAAADDDERWFVLQALGWSRTDAAAFGIVVFAVIVIVVNGLMFQTGPHPAPMFKGEPQVAVRAAPAAPKEVAALPRARPAAASAPKAEPRASAEVVSDIQRELARRGYYDGAVDGRYGSRTDAAVREFEQAAGIKPSTEPNETLLAAIKGSSAKSARTVTAGVRPAAQPVRQDAIADTLASSKRVLAVQRALAEYGYGQIKQTGVVDAETRAAIEKFERERKLPVTGQISDRFTRELVSITGRTLE